MRLSSNQTIAALSTPPGQSGIAVVRASGHDALDLLARVFRPASGEAAAEWEHRRLYHGHVVDAAGEVVDEVMCAIMRSPATYTGEDVVELSCHGGMVVVSRILEVFFAAGARPAEAGEFTKRAFLNGKMDLIQAEAVADIIHAQSELQRTVAQRQLAGSLSERIDSLADDMVQLLGLIEANIDFIEEDIDALDTDVAVGTLDRIARDLDGMLEGASLTKPFRDGFHVAIAGPVNAGKSCLFNRLVGEQRAIVTDIPGTTRDLLREPVVLDGLVFLFHDTAGLRDVVVDRVESIGIDRAADAVRSADAVVFVIDGSLEPDDATLAALRSLEPERVIAVLNKSDLWGHQTGGCQAEAAVRGLDTALDCVKLSAVRGDGVDQLQRALVAKVGGEALATMARERVVLNARLVDLLGDARKKNRVLRKSLRSRAPLEIMALEAREALVPFEQATGRTYQDGVLDAIFSRFCIGK